MKFLMVDNSCLLTDKVAIDQRFTQVKSPQLIKQNTHYESPAFGSQIEAILARNQVNRVGGKH